ncbi:ABC transporter ATP-binding protein [Paenibacillus mesophilus]|uniref:ABC transporter ATP-binding protein n=1 Tax=Paenibacillus mesophilus TaxID=2582849 RepID=UPI001EE484A4|nr:ABC transporter ATP-binding protein [Paenibacillus mesophilus]
MARGEKERDPEEARNKWQGRGRGGRRDPDDDWDREYERDPSKNGKYYFTIYMWLLTYLKPYKWQMVLFILCGLFISLSQMSIFRVLQHIIDDVVMAGNAQKFKVIVGVLVLILLCMFSAMAANNLLSRLIREKASRDLQFDCIKQLRRLSFSYYECHPVGETLSLLNSDVQAVQGIYQRHFPNLINNALLLFVAFGFVLHMNAALTLVTLPCFLLYYVVGPYLTKRTSFWGKLARDRRTDWNRKIYESITGLTEMRANRSESWDLERFKEKHESYNESQRKQFMFRGLRALARQLSSFAGMMVMFIYGAYLNRIGALSVGEFVAFTMYYQMLNRQSSQLVSIFMDQSLLLHQGEKLKDFMGLKPVVTEAEQPVVLPRVNGSLSFRGVRFGYGGPDILRGFTLDIRAGERVALVGTSGNGKSTILKLIDRFYDPAEGEIVLDGVPLKELSMNQLRDSIGIVFQDIYLFGTTIRENIRFGYPEATDEQVEEAAKAAYAHDFIMALPGGYDTNVGERGVKLSGGQRQRISIARMFIKNPRIVLLDEATSALDNVSEREVLKALEQLMKGRTTVTVAHRISTVRDYDRIIVVKDGQVAEAGSYRELVAGRGWLYELEGGMIVNG